MTAERGFALHPLAAQDITEIWDYMAENNPLAARRVREEIHSAIRALVPFPNQGHRRQDNRQTLGQLLRNTRRHTDALDQLFRCNRAATAHRRPTITDFENIY
jgi:plasmid stabilization system protein ParE